VTNGVGAIGTSGRRNLLDGGARLTSFIFGSLVGRFLCVSILLWCSAFLSSHSFRDFFLRAGTGFSCFYRRRNLTQDRADHSPTGGPSGSGGRGSSIGNFASERFGFFSGAFPAATTVSCTLVIMGFFASIAVATLSKTTLAAVVLAALAVVAALATSPASALAPSVALFPAATMASCALVMMPLLVISTPAWLSSSDLPVAAQTSTLEGGQV